MGYRVGISFAYIGGMLSKYFLFLTIFSIIVPTGQVFASGSCKGIFLTQANRSQVDFQILEKVKKNQNKEQELGVEPDHQTRAYLIRDSSGAVKKTNRSIVIFHGLLNSPKHTAWLAERLHKLGYNVLNVRLAGHYTADRGALDRISYKDWFLQAKETAELAQGLGNKVVYVGHSTGNILALIAAFHSPQKVAALIRYSAATKVRLKAKVLSYVPSRIGVSGWLLDMKNRLLDQALGRYMSTYSGVEVNRAAKELEKLEGFETDNPDFKGSFGYIKQILSKIPTLSIDSAVDATVNSQLNQELTSQLPAGKQIWLSKEDNIRHNKTISSRAENPRADEILDTVIEFIRE